MKKKSIISFFALLLGLSITTTSCEDMLTPDMERNAPGFTGNDTVNFYFGILSTVQQLAENNVILGEVRADLVDTTSYVSDSVARIANFESDIYDGENGLLNRAAYYKVIQQCNEYLGKVDTFAQKFNFYYMRRECAQVEFIRAWTYMQLVQLYGEVPFITRFADNADTGWETNPEAWANADNIYDLLMKSGLKKAYAYEKTYGRPNYGTLNNGAVSMPHSNLVFRGDVVLGDLRLLTAKSEADYKEAAVYYYNFLSDEAKRYNQYVKSNNRCNLAVNEASGTDEFSFSSEDWAGSFINQYGGNSENITSIPSAANGRIGNTLTRVQQIYGFDPSSHSSSSSDAESGSISVKANYKNRQVAPSKKYLYVNKAQQPVYMKRGQVNQANYAETIGDGRYYASVSNVRTDMGDLPFVQKFAKGNAFSQGYVIPTAFSFNYALPVYRIRQVYLHFAEALNRAGYPRYAFAVLRNGLSKNALPTLAEEVEYDDEAFAAEHPNFNAETYDPKTGTYTVEGENGEETKIAVDFTKYAKRVYIKEEAVDDSKGNNFLTIGDLYAATLSPEFLDFTDDIWRNCGIHELGNGSYAYYHDRYNYGPVVGQRILDEAKRLEQCGEAPSASDREHGQALMQEVYVDTEEDPSAPSEPGEGEGTAPAWHKLVNARELDEPVAPAAIDGSALAAEQNAMETLIADELALETAFEGNRFGDLVRMAKHKMAKHKKEAGINGINWLAWTIARRAVKFAPYEEVDQYDQGLYNKLQTESNWYLPSPVSKP